MNSRDRVLSALRLEQPDRVPYVETRVDLAMQRILLGLPPAAKARVTGLKHLCSMELNEVLGLDNLQLRFLPPIFAEFDGEFPVRPLIRSRDDLDLMVFPNPEDPALYAEAEQIIRQARGRYAIGASVRAGISGTHLCMGLDGLSYALADDPGLVDTVMGRYADWAIAIIGHLRELGVDCVWTFDDIAYKTGPMVASRTFSRVFAPHLRRVADAIKSEGMLWIYHSDGNMMPLLDELLALGVHGFHPIEPGAMDIREVKVRYGDRLCLIGNIDLRYTLTQGTPEEVEAEVRERIETIGMGGGYMVSSANTVTEYCKPDNVRAMGRAVLRYGRYPKA